MMRVGNHRELLVQEWRGCELKHHPADQQKVCRSQDKCECEPDRHGAPFTEREAVSSYRGDTSRSRNRGGAGLGLVIAATIAEWHGGSATVVNEGRDGGTGLTVRVTLPLGGGVVRDQPAL
jgi:hypothetical protein